VNPVSGTDTAPDALPLINERLRTRFGPLDIALTVAPGDAAALARAAAIDGYDHLFAVGGDGTLNEVLNGVAAVDGALSRITFGVIPLGTGNDFATALGMPGELEDGLAMLLDARPERVDLGVVNDACFVNASAGGFIADVSEAVTPALKSIAGRLAYLIGGAQVLLDYEPVRAEIVTADSPPGARSLHAYAVCNSRLVGGGRLIAPDALIDDGVLDVCLIDAMPTVEFVALLRRVSSGEHVRDPRVSYFRSASIDLAFDRRIRINTDGEVRETDRVRYTVQPRAAWFLAHRSMAFTLSAPE
jgi:diacylglycerol kinase (ATP)